MAEMGVSLDMSKKAILLVVLCLIGAVALMVMLPANPAKINRHGTRIQAVNSLPSFSFTLTNRAATNLPPVAKP